jgi:type VI secretion system secreted protein VgrG
MAAPAIESQLLLATQTGRLLEVTTPLPFDAIVINGFSGSEAISGLFQFNLDLLSARPITMDKLLGKPVLTTMRDGENKRPFHGIVSHIACGSRTGLGAWRYHAQVVPWLWLLTQKSTSRVFQNKSVVEIITSIFDDLKKPPFSDVVAYEDKTTAGRHIPLDYCVQYRETDFNFVSRLMEQDGIFYFFQHNEEKHTLILADDNGAFPKKETNVRYVEGGIGEREGIITRWEEGLTVRPGKYSMRDHHFQLPDQPLDVTTGDQSHPLEIYEYPGQYALRFKEPDQRLGQVSAEGDKLVNVRMDEEELPGHVFSGNSTSRKLGNGQRLTLTHHPSSSGKYIVTSITHSIAQSPDYISGHQRAGIPYHSSFSCVAASNRIRPSRVTPKPMIAGPQTAVVAVKQDEESWLDKFGRVRVQFHWQRNSDGKSPEANESSTCWVRVVQPWAGNSWGAHFWPRVGQEVVVEFLEVDPDRPIITGSVYNAKNMPPYPLPANYTRSGIITRSSKKGGTKNFNELRFEDKIGQEQIFLNAERDMDHRVEHDLRQFVGSNHHLSVGASQFESIGGDASRQVTGNHNEKITKKMSLEVLEERHEKIGKIYTVHAGKEIHLDSGEQLVIHAEQQISIHVGGSIVNITSGGITIDGKPVHINCGDGKAAPGTDSKPDPPAGPEVADDGSKGGKLG